MIRRATKVSRLLVSCLLPTLAMVVVCYMRITTPPQHPQMSGKRDFVQPQNATTKVTVAFDKVNPDATGPIVTYGSDKSRPEFVPRHDRGARILLLAYAR